MRAVLVLESLKQRGLSPGRDISVAGFGDTASRLGTCDSLTSCRIDFVRLGRVSLMYQTPDGNETGYWNQNTRSWVVDDEYKEAVLKAIKVAKKMAAPDLLEVPVPAPKSEVQS